MDASWHGSTAAWPSIDVAFRNWQTIVFPFVHSLVSVYHSRNRSIDTVDVLLMIDSPANLSFPPRRNCTVRPTFLCRSISYPVEKRFRGVPPLVPRLESSVFRAALAIISRLDNWQRTDNRRNFRLPVRKFWRVTRDGSTLLGGTSFN